MAIVKWNPWREMEDLFDRYTRAVDRPQSGELEIVKTGDWSPRVDIAETDNAFIIKAEIPEVKKDDVKVTVENGVLSITGERKQEKEEKGKKFHRIERYYGSFCRSFTLPENADGKQVKATFKEGILNVEIPKTKEAATKATEVKIE